LTTDRDPLIWGDVLFVKNVHSCCLKKSGSQILQDNFKLRETLVIKPGSENPVRLEETIVRKEIRKLFKSALKLRQVSAGGDNSTELELNACGNVNFDMGGMELNLLLHPVMLTVLLLQARFRGIWLKPWRLL